MKKRAIYVAIIVLILAGIIFILNKPSEDSKIGVGVIEPMKHIAIDDITRGINDGLGNSGKEFVIHVKNANNDTTTIPQIIESFKDQGIDVFVPIFTKTAQIVQKNVLDKPVVFAAVTDPVASGILKNPDAPQKNITGVSDLWPISSQLELIRKILPASKKIGMIYDPGDASSSVTLPLISKEAKVQGFELELRPVHSTNEIGQSLSSLLGQVDLIFTANDVTVTAAFPALVDFAIKNKIPLFAGDYSSVQRGAVCTIGQNYYNVGLEASKLILAVSEGEKISSLSLRFTKGGDIYINSKAAELMGVDIPKEISLKAKQIYQKIEEKND